MNAKRTFKFRGYALVASIFIFALVLSACGLGGTPSAVEVTVVVPQTQIVREVVTATPKPVDLQATAGYEATEIVSAAQTEAAEVPEQAAPAATEVQAAAATEAPAATAAPESVETQHVWSWSVNGASAQVNEDVVLRAVGDDAYGNHFENVTGLGTEMMFAEPGTLLVGPDFDPNLVEQSGGHIEWISPITQQLLGTPEFSTNTAEGAFTWATGARMTVQVGDYTVNVDGDGCENWFVVLRGLFADGEQNSDRNSTTHFSGYVPGHAQVMWYPQGAYISEGNFKQVAELSHTDGRNCGAEGSSKLSVLMLDLNTGAYDVVSQGNTDKPWEFVASNWR